MAPAVPCPTALLKVPAPAALGRAGGAGSSCTASPDTSVSPTGLPWHPRWLPLARRRCPDARLAGADTPHLLRVWVSIVEFTTSPQPAGGEEANIWKQSWLSRFKEILHRREENAIPRPSSLPLGPADEQEPASCHGQGPACSPAPPGWAAPGTSLELGAGMGQSPTVGWGHPNSVPEQEGRWVGKLPRDLAL